MLTDIPTSHEVRSHEDVSVPLFENKFLDKFSRVAWYVPILLFTPVIIYFLYLSFSDPSLNIFKILGLFLFGMLVWTSAEYFFHRFVFHYEAKSKFGKKIFFLIHGIHHAFPADSMRLVMPPIMSIPLAVSFYFVFSFLFGSLLVAIFPGFLLGYVLYDTMHYAIHHFDFIKHPFFLKMKKHHMRHHYAEPDMGFGVSSDFWDNLMRTTFKKKD